MKVFAIATAQPTFTPEKIAQYMPHEVPATLKLYLDGKVEQFWFRDKTGPIFLMNVESVDQAKAILNTLPLVADGPHDLRISAGGSARAARPADSERLSESICHRCAMFENQHEYERPISDQLIAQP